MAAELSPGDTGLQLLENAATAAAGLFTFILMFGPVSGTHLNPVVSLSSPWRGNLAPAAVGACTGSAYFFTSSTSFAIPAIDVGRMLTDTFAGIAPASVPALVVVQLLGGVVGLLVIRALYPDLTPDEAAEVVLPHDDHLRLDAAASS